MEVDKKELARQRTNERARMRRRAKKTVSDAPQTDVIHDMTAKKDEAKVAEVEAEVEDEDADVAGPSHLSAAEARVLAKSQTMKPPSGSRKGGGKISVSRTWMRNKPTVELEEVAETGVAVAPLMTKKDAVEVMSNGGRRYMLRASDQWTTPRHLFAFLNERFDFVLDACAQNQYISCLPVFISPEQDALHTDWWEHAQHKVNQRGQFSVFCNPPYSSPNTEQFMHKAITTLQTLPEDTPGVAVFLIPATLGSTWYESCVIRYGSEIWLSRGRVQFGPGYQEVKQLHAAPFDICVCVFTSSKCKLLPSPTGDGSPMKRKARQMYWSLGSSQWSSRELAEREDRATLPVGISNIKEDDSMEGMSTVPALQRRTTKSKKTLDHLVGARPSEQIICLQCQTPFERVLSHAQSTRTHPVETSFPQPISHQSASHWVTSRLPQYLCDWCNRYHQPSIGTFYVPITPPTNSSIKIHPELPRHTATSGTTPSATRITDFFTSLKR